MGQIDALVCSAGVAGQNANVVDYPIAEWKRVFDINVNGLFYCNRFVAALMKARGYGRIVNVASIAGKEGNPTASAYSASKAAVIGLTKSLGKELAKDGVTVNAVTPATIETPILQQVTPEFIAYMRSKIPMDRFGTLDEAASLICGSPAANARSAPARSSICPAAAPPIDVARCRPASFARSLIRLGLVGAAEAVRVTPLTGGVSSDISLVEAGGQALLRQARPAAPQGRGAVGGAHRAQRGRGGVDARRRGVGCPRAVPKILGEDPDGGPVRHGLPAARGLSAVEDGASRGPTVDQDFAAAVGRDLALIHARSAAEPGLRAAFAQRRDVRGDPHRALSARDRRARIPRSQRRFDALAGDDARDQARAGAWRRQPEEHPERPARARSSSTRNAHGSAIPPSTSPSASTICS